MFILPRLRLGDLLLVKFYGKTESHGSVKNDYKNLIQFRVEPQKIAIFKIEQYLLQRCWNPSKYIRE
jgi:hypothetical protein